jgi:hypothetical protein
MAPCRAASEVEATADAAAPAAAAVPKQAAVWELDFCSRPILDERKKKVWELLICDPERTFEYSEYFPNNKINSVQVTEHARHLRAQGGQFASGVPPDQSHSLSSRVGPRAKSSGGGMWRGVHWSLHSTAPPVWHCLRCVWLMCPASESARALSGRLESSSWTPHAHAGCSQHPVSLTAPVACVKSPSLERSVGKAGEMRVLQLGRRQGQDEHAEYSRVTARFASPVQSHRRPTLAP